MKSFKTLLGAALVMAGFTACNNNNELTELGEAPQSGLREMSFTVSAGGEGDTRSHLVNGTSVVFDAGDAISVFDDEGLGHNNEFRTTAGGSVATFTGTAPAASTYYFLNPYQINGCVTGGKILAEVPYEQFAVAGSYDPAALISVGSGTSTDPIALHNACALIKFEIASGLSDIREIKLFSTGKIAGLANFNADGSIDSYGGTTYDHVTLRGTIAAGETYYICVLPGDLGKLTVQYVTSTGEVKERKAVNALTAVAGKLYDFGEINGSVYSDPLTFTARVAGEEVTLKAEGSAPTISLQYRKTTSGAWGSWTDYTIGDGISLTEVGDKVQFKAPADATQTKLATAPGNSHYHHFILSKPVDASGSVMSLLKEGAVMANWAFANLFKSCDNLMSAPELPATTLAQLCYIYMFSGCTGLTTAPVLPATSLAANCYEYMFYGCTSLTTGPELPATTLKPFCYNYMFRHCNNLNELTVHFTSWIDDERSCLATEGWLYNVASDGVLHCPNGLDTSSQQDESHLPSNWSAVSI